MNCSVLNEKLDKGLIKTPCYIADMCVLDNHIARMKEIAGDTVKLCYAMKANPFLTKHIDEQVGCIEVCSPGELEICMELKVPGKDIIFSGVNKTAQNIEAAMRYGVDIITLESVKHFELVKSYCTANNCPAKVLIRLSSGAQFGMALNELKDIIKNRDEYPQLEIVGIHYFTGTQKKQAAKDIEEINLIDELIKSLRDDYGYECKLFEYGPGLAVPYFEGEDFDARYEALKELVAYVKELNPQYRITFELGRFFVAESMQYLTTVEDIKRTADINICLVDGGIHHLNYYGQNMAMRVPRIEVIRRDDKGVGITGSIDEEDGNWKVCGSLCTFADTLVRKVELGKLSLGDVLVFGDAGAYSVTEAPVLFLSRRMPDIYVCETSGVINTLRKDKEAFVLNMQE